MVKIGEEYRMTPLQSVAEDGAPVYAVSIENRTRGLHARGRPSRDLEEAEQSAWAAMATVEGS